MTHDGPCLLLTFAALACLAASMSAHAPAVLATRDSRRARRALGGIGWMGFLLLATLTCMLVGPVLGLIHVSAAVAVAGVGITGLVTYLPHQLPLFALSAASVGGALLLISHV